MPLSRLFLIGTLLSAGTSLACSSRQEPGSDNSTASVVDSEGRMVPSADNLISLSVGGAGGLVATDNGNAMDRTAFNSADRNAFSGIALTIVRARANQSGEISGAASSQGLTQAEIVLTALRITALRITAQ